MLNRVEAAAYCGVSPSTFDKMLSDGLVPHPVKVYACRLYDVRRLDQALDCLSDGADPDDENEWDSV